MIPSMGRAILVAAVIACTSSLSTGRAAADEAPAPSTVIVVDLLPAAHDLDPAATREAAARELGVRVVAPDDVDSRNARLTITIDVDPARGELTVARRGPNGPLVRRVALPSDPDDARRAAVFLIGNLARDEAPELLGELRAGEPAVPGAATGVARASAEAAPRVWMGIAGQIDIASMPAAGDVCKLRSPPDPGAGTPLNSAGYACISGGNDYPGPGTATNDAIELGRADTVASGLAPANVRLLLTLDYATNANLMVGLRFGYVLDTYPGTVLKRFPSIHAEARITYVLGKEPLATAGLAPYGFAGGGVAEWDAQVAVTAIENGNSKNVQAWHVSGPAFLSVGGGVRWAITARFAGTFGPRLNLAFGDGGIVPSVSPEIGLAYGF
jgi:hypothetical protein